jgi:hypothetical protein
MRWRDVLTATKPSDLYGVTVLKDVAASLAAPAARFKPAVDRSKMAVTCVLTTPAIDRQGDIIEPAGGDFSEHMTNPVVMFHHGKQHKLPIGKAEDEYGNYTVRLVKSQDGPLLASTTHFSQKNRFAQDVFGLIDEDILRGVSIGFDPDKGDDSVEELGPKCPILKRPPLHFKNWKLLEYSHTPIGVHRDALTVAVHKAMDGSRSLDPRLLAMLKPLAEPRKTVVAVSDTDPTRVEKGAGCTGMGKKQRAAVALDKARRAGKKVPPKVEKAMPTPPEEEEEDDGTEPDTNEDTDAAGDTADQGAAGEGDEGDDTDPGAAGDDAYDPASDNPSEDPMLKETGQGYAQPDPDQPPPPTVQTLTDGAQGLMDLCSAIEAGMKQSEHMKGRKYAAKLCADLKKTAAEVNSFAQKVHAELQGGPAPDESEDTAPGDDSDNDTQPPEEPETDEDGALVTKGYAARRWAYADLAGAAPVVQPTPDVQRMKALERENAKLRRSLENILNDVEAANRRGR